MFLFGSSSWFCLPTMYERASQVVQGWRICLPMEKMQETQVWFLGWKDTLEEVMATHSNILAWKIPWTEEAGGLQSVELQRVRHDWACTHTQCMENTGFLLLFFTIYKGQKKTNLTPEFILAPCRWERYTSPSPFVYKPIKLIWRFHLVASLSSSLWSIYFLWNQPH